MAILIDETKRVLVHTHDRPSPQNAFIGWGFERKIAKRSTDINFFALEPEQ